MRLIDADDISYVQAIDATDDLDYVRRYNIDRMPTIDAVPVKYGEWSAYEVSGYRKCSMCGGYVNWNPKPFLFGDGEYNYCPNCGACMTTKTPIDKDELAY